MGGNNVLALRFDPDVTGVGRELSAFEFQSLSQASPWKTASAWGQWDSSAPSTDWNRTLNKSVQSEPCPRRQVEASA